VANEIVVLASISQLYYVFTTWSMAGAEDVARTTALPRGGRMTRLVASVVIVEDDQVLLQRSERSGIVWGLPGGVVEDDESVAHAAVREAKEETGLEVQLERLIGVYSRGDDVHIVVFAGRAVGGRLQADADEVLEVPYFDPEDLPDSLVPAMRLQIEAALAGVGGGIVWSGGIPWPFAPDRS
jgi:8-oxo-dGTP diphosphatase